MAAKLYRLWLSFSPKSPRDINNYAWVQSMPPRQRQETLMAIIEKHISETGWRPQNATTDGLDDDMFAL